MFERDRAYGPERQQPIVNVAPKKPKRTQSQTQTHSWVSFVHLISIFSVVFLSSSSLFLFVLPFVVFNFDARSTLKVRKLSESLQAASGTFSFFYAPFVCVCVSIPLFDFVVVFVFFCFFLDLLLNNTYVSWCIWKKL